MRCKVLKEFLCTGLILMIGSFVSLKLTLFDTKIVISQAVAQTTKSTASNLKGPTQQRTFDSLSLKLSITEHISKKEIHTQDLTLKGNSQTTVKLGYSPLSSYSAIVSLKPLTVNNIPSGYTLEMSIIDSNKIAVAYASTIVHELPINLNTLWAVKTPKMQIFNIGLNAFN